MPQRWEPAEIHCLSWAMPQPCHSLWQRRAPSQPGCCLGKRGAGMLLRWEAGMLLRLAAASSHTALAGATLTPICMAVGSTEALLYVGPVTPAQPPFKTPAISSRWRVVWGSSYSPKVPNPFIKYSLLAPQVCNMLCRLWSQ